MTPLGIGMPVDLHVVGRIEERRVDRLAFSNDRAQELEVVSVAAADAVIAKLPDVADLCARLQRNRRNDLVVGIRGLAKHDIDLAGAEPGERQVHLELGQRQVGQLELEDLEVPTCIERDLVVSEPQRLLLRFAEPGQLNHRNFGKLHRLGCEQPAMSGDQPALGIREDRVGKPERADRGGDLLDLPLRMRACIAGIGDETAGRPVGDRQRADDRGIGRGGCAGHGAALA